MTTRPDLTAIADRDSRIAEVEDWLRNWPGPLRLMSGDKSIPAAHNTAPDHVRFLLAERATLADRVRQLEVDLADAHRDAMVNRDTANRAHAAIDRVSEMADELLATGSLLTTQGAVGLALRAALDAGEGQ